MGTTTSTEERSCSRSWDSRRWWRRGCRGGLSQNQRLERIAELVDWSWLGQLVAGSYTAPGGWPSYPPLLMVKVLLLQPWYNLSDPAAGGSFG